MFDLSVVRGALLSATLCLVMGSGAGAETLRVYHVGNSLTDALRAEDFGEVVSAGGRHDYEYGQHLIWGSSLDYLWYQPDQVSKTKEPYGTFTEALPGHDWDVVTLQPFQRPLVTGFGQGPAGDTAMTLAFIDHTLQNPANRDTRFLIYQHSPMKRYYGDNSAGDPNFAEPDFGEWWTGRPYTGQWDQTWETSGYYDLLRASVQDELDARPASDSPSTAVEVVPVGDVFHAMHRVMRAGGLSGFEFGSTAWDLYTDDVHFGATGQYATAMTFYAVMYGESPVGLPVGDYAERYVYTDGAPLISAERAAQIQALAWAVVSGGPVEGDADLNGTVNQADLDAVLGNWGQSGTRWAGGDFDGDGSVEQADLDAVLTAWGGSTAPDLLPEPGLGLVCLALGGLALRRRRAQG